MYAQNVMAETPCQGDQYSIQIVITIFLNSFMFIFNNLMPAILYHIDICYLLLVMMTQLRPSSAHTMILQDKLSRNNAMHF